MSTPLTKKRDVPPENRSTKRARNIGLMSLPDEVLCNVFHYLMVPSIIDKERPLHLKQSFLVACLNRRLYTAFQSFLSRYSIDSNLLDSVLYCSVCGNTWPAPHTESLLNIFHPFITGVDLSAEGLCDHLTSVVLDKITRTATRLGWLKVKDSFELLPELHRIAMCFRNLKSLSIIGPTLDTIGNLRHSKRLREVELLQIPDYDRFSVPSMFGWRKYGLRAVSFAEYEEGPINTVQFFVKSPYDVKVNLFTSMPLLNYVAINLCLCFSDLVSFNVISLTGDKTGALRPSLYEPVDICRIQHSSQSRHSLPFHENWRFPVQPSPGVVGKATTTNSVRKLIPLITQSMPPGIPLELSVNFVMGEYTDQSEGHWFFKVNQLDVAEFFNRKGCLLRDITEPSAYSVDYSGLHTVTVDLGRRPHEARDNRTDDMRSQLFTALRAASSSIKTLQLIGEPSDAEWCNCATGIAESIVSMAQNISILYISAAFLYEMQARERLPLFMSHIPSLSEFNIVQLEMKECTKPSPVDVAGNDNRVSCANIISILPSILNLVLSYLTNLKTLCVWGSDEAMPVRYVWSYTNDMRAVWRALHKFQEKRRDVDIKSLVQKIEELDNELPKLQMLAVMQKAALVRGLEQFNC